METKIGEVNGEEIVAGPNGGAGSKIPWYELVDARALEEIAAVFTHGAQKYQRDNWRAVPVEEHLRHLIRHAFRFLELNQQYPLYPEPGIADRASEDLSHLACRAVMALAVWLQDDHVGDVVPKGLAKPAEPQSWSEKLDEMGHEFDKNGRIVAKERDSLWTGEDVYRRWPESAPSDPAQQSCADPARPPRYTLYEIRVPSLAEDEISFPQPDTNYRVVPRFAPEDGLAEPEASESEHGEEDKHRYCSPPCSDDKVHWKTETRSEILNDQFSVRLEEQPDKYETIDGKVFDCPSPQSQPRTYSLYDFGKFEMLESDYLNRESVGLWADKDKARQTIEGLVARGWARLVP